MLTDIRQNLLRMRSNDEGLREELAADGQLFEGYHPRMEKLHRTNASALKAIIREYGWPVEGKVAPDGAEAAWLIAQHAIALPSFMRLCRRLIDKASLSGFVPRWQFAYIDDRIRVFEGKPQLYGTQFHFTPEGAVLYEFDDLKRVASRRQDVGLGSVSDLLDGARAALLPTAAEYAQRQARELSWRKCVGWNR